MKKSPLILLLLLTLFLTATGAREARKPLVLRVTYLEDSRFPTLTREQMDEALEYARLVLAREYDLPGLIIEWRGPVSIESYFSTVLSGKTNTWKRVDPFNPRWDEPGEGYKTFLTFFKMEDLKEAMPEHLRGGVTGPESYRKAAIAAWEARIPAFTGLTLNGKKVFTPETLAWQTYTGWRTLFDHQTDTDLYITNTLIFYDPVEFPYPHVVFYQCKTGGIGDVSPGAPFGNGNAAMVSLAGYTNLPGFPGPAVPPEELPRVLGVYMIAHELTHMILDIPDNYDHGLDCLMYSPAAETIDPAAGAQAVLNDPAPCPECRQLVAKGKKRLRKLGY